MSQILKLENTKVRFANLHAPGEYKGRQTGRSITVEISDAQAAEVEKFIQPLQALGFSRSPLRANKDKDGNIIEGKLLKLGIRMNKDQRPQIKLLDDANKTEEPKFGQLLDAEVEFDTYSTPAIGKGISTILRKATLGKLPEFKPAELEFDVVSDSLDV